MCNWFLNQNILKSFKGKFWLLWFYNIKCNYSSDYNILSTNWGKCKILKIYIPQLFPIFFLTAIFWDSLWHQHAHFFRFSYGSHHTLISLVVPFLQSSSHFWFHDSYTYYPPILLSPYSYQTSSTILIVFFIVWRPIHTYSQGWLIPLVS